MDLGAHSIIWPLIIGLVIGAIAKSLMPGKDSGGYIVTIPLGMVGAFAGTWIGRILAGANYVAGWIMSIVGAMILLLLYLINARRRTIKNRRIESSPKPLIPAPTAPSETSPDSRSVFISYRRLDSADITGRIYDRLAQHFGKASIFKDVDSIPLGIDFRKHLQNSVGQCSVLLVIIGKNWLAAADKGKPRLNDAKDHLRIELETALQRDIPIIPILVQGATVPEEDSLPPSLGLLAYRNGIEVRPDPDFHGDMNRLIRGVEACLQELR